MDDLVYALEKNLRGSAGRRKVRLLVKKWAWVLVVGGSRALKRLLDLMIGAAMALIAAPLFAALAILIRLDSPARSSSGR